MCGICGIVNFDREESVDKNVLIEMKDIMTHRGPDDDGLCVDGNVGLGFRRLSIVDLSYGHQPMCNENGDIWIVFNGEIYNHLDIRKELISRGHIYKTKSDTESIIHLYEEEGVDGFTKLNGMFGIALWDGRRRRLILARDRLGIKPLYYSRSNGSLVFASEIKSILKSRKVEAALNVPGLEEYFIFRFLAGEKTMFENIYNLLPGHVLVFEGGKIETQKFWDLREDAEFGDIDERDAVSQLGELLEDSVRLRLMSDVPLGTFCSGGVDSSITSAYASQLSDIGLNTFSVGFHETAYDESKYAKIVSDKYGTHHHQLTVDNKTFADSLPKLIWHNDEPLNHANSVQIYHISKLAKEYVTVVLTGEGADELFGGYPRYLIARACRNLTWTPHLFRSVFNILPIPGILRRVRKLGRFLPLSLREGVALNSYFVDWELTGSLLTGEGNLKNVIDSRLSLLGDATLSRKNVMNVLTRLDLKTYLVSILNRQDKMSMAAGLESRVPFLDHRLVEWGLRIPENLKNKGYETKTIVKRLGEKLLPNEVVYRRKSGFGVPVSEWMREKKGMGRYLDLFFEPRFAQRGYLRTDSIQKMAQEHLSGKYDHGEILWELINLELWYRIFMEEEAVGL